MNSCHQVISVQKEDDITEKTSKTDASTEGSKIATTETWVLSLKKSKIT